MQMTIGKGIAGERSLIRAVKKFSSSELIMNSRRLGTHTKGTSSSGPRHLGTF